MSPPRVSFEFFPPKSLEAERSLWNTVDRLAPLQPEFVSVTYGADGSTRERTHQVIQKLLNKTALLPVPHLTCVGAPRDEIDAIADSYWNMGVRQIVALRGDPEGGSDAGYSPHPDGYAYASDLVEGLMKLHPFELFVAAYPETHPQALSSDADLDNLRRKIDKGSRRAITQFFFDNDIFLRFRDQVAKAGIKVDLIPGVLPVTNYNSLLRFASACGTNIPSSLARLFEGLDEDPVTRQLIAAHVSVDQAEALGREGVEDFHFYTLNRADLSFAVCHALGVRGSQ
ncbi:methylenetetrahydrofolate reductase [NAD(P)H] [Litorivicinus sp.]|jgi:methylenetetrahydrofolate reductase (NADPH)|nr:methylenetetrahydrofolate reductase [NAD(P)H] [Litorivicinus sp.]MDC1240722.1 methylenetetrahydrofolate reductase [NAD(P)H] [Litorivicinus sp.]MDC1466254.1 methylenetetrahydrofolate reductase [NAD(P)H] [Litorivicinus sp.]|tara:strand:- start:18069 stop:18923 length:855 start_codon:yes stop_codon:yes gene_type:complete